MSFIPDKDSSGNYLFKLKTFANSDGFRFRGQGVAGTATKTTGTNIDYKLAEARHVNGIRILLKDHAWGDSCHFEVVDVDNVLGLGAGYVVDRFGDTWYIDPNISTQPDVIIPYPASIPANLYIRLIYNSVGVTTDVSVQFNLFLHKQVV